MVFNGASLNCVIKAPFDISKTHGPTDWPAVIIPSNAPINDLAKKKKSIIIRTENTMVPNS